MDVSVIIVNYNTSKVVSKAIESSLKQTGISFEILVIDNASPDDSLKVLKSYGDKIRLIESSQNLGFGLANNKAFEQSQGDYLFLINPDAEFTSPHALANMLLFMKNHPEMGLAGTRMIDEHGIETPPLYHYPGDKKYHYLFENLPGSITWVLGASMMIPRTIWEKTGGFDKSYFLYGEEVDWCLRIRKAGYTIGYNDKVTVFHEGGASEKSETAFATWTRKQQGLQNFIQHSYPKEIGLKIIQRDLRRNLFRLKTLQLINLFSGWNEKKRAKAERYRAIITCTKKTLQG